MEHARSEGKFYERGDLGGLFPNTRLLVCVPVVSRTTGEELGGVVVSTELTQVNTLLSHTTNIFLITGIVVFIIAITAISIYANKETKPLKELAKTAREFGHGNLSARAPTGGGNTEEMDELAAAFNNMATSLEKSEIQRREFVANVSHELKTPMTTIAGYIDGMLDGTIPPEQHAKYMTRVSDEVRRLSRLVRSMLEISKIQDQGIPESRKQRFDICESMGRVLLTFEQKINVKHLNVEVQMPDNGIGVWAEEDSITQVIYNLTDNAVKFAAPGSCITVRLYKDGGKAYISIKDYGETIPPEDLPFIFDRFHKSDRSRSLDKDGVGLGLYLVKSIINSHDEDIAVKSEDGMTEFVFTLPLAEK